jgi:hypothetical protein
MQIHISVHFEHHWAVVTKTYRLMRKKYMYHIHTDSYVNLYTTYSTYMCVCIYEYIYKYTVRLELHFKFFYEESEKGLKEPKHVACIKTHSSVRRYWTVYSLNTVITAECPASR